MGAKANKPVAGFENVHVLIMAGGSGTRFWPKSRVRRPKQLLALWDEKTLLEHTVLRFAKNIPQENIWIVTTESLVGPSKEVLGDELSGVNFLGEPTAKNTAACILWGVQEIRKAEQDAVVAVMPADHFIGDEAAFNESLKVAITKAKSTASLVTLGIKPNRPETGYGYIEVDRSLAGTKLEPQPLLVRQFVEKPDLRTALRYIESGRYLWNAGMFIFSAATGIESFKRCMPELHDLFEKSVEIAQTYSQITKRDTVSVDYGVMEQAVGKGIEVAVVPADCGWNDVGSFPALEEIDCATLGEVVTHDSASNIVQTDSGIVALLGVNDLVVVRDGDVVLVASKDRSQDVKTLLEKVRLSHPDKV